ncbi:MAG: hypothetical protein E7591_06260 [Ruminococcaceae bacterium]|nr:hypothetical protein [Oscillospiraceae bacterium]
MDFKKKLRTRLYLAISYIILGCIMIAASFIMKPDNEFISSFGIALAVVGLVRLRNYVIITRSEERIKKQEILETDERNIFIVNKARSVSFIVYTLLLCVAVIVLSFLNMHQIAMWISLSVFLLIAVYWISYFIIRKKS